MANGDLFEASVVTNEPAAPIAAERPEPPRVVTANRRQVQLRPCDLESLVPPDHRARARWSTVERLELPRCYAAIAARGREPGRSAIALQMLVALWRYATSDGVGRTRALARLCEAHYAYRWIGGGVPVNHHTRSDVPVSYADALDALRTQVLAVLRPHGLVTLTRVAQDGMRVRASAGAASFRREKSGRPERVARALAELPQVEAVKARTKRGEARVSTTDSEARVMQMGDGGDRPADNVPLAAETASRVRGVQATNAGSDKAPMRPMLEERERRPGVIPPV